MTDPERWGVDRGYHDAHGQWQTASAETLAAVLSAMGAVGDADPYAEGDGRPAMLTVRLDHPLPTAAPGTVTLEDGGELAVPEGVLPPDLPSGYHTLVDRDGRARPLVVSPGRSPLPLERRWGLAAQLYAARSRRSWGIGDLGDLAELTRWAGRAGAGPTLLNPLHAAPPGQHQQPSPYFPSSRCFLNPLYLRVEDVPGASGVDAVARLGRAGRELNRSRLVDRDQVWALKSEALEAVFASRGLDAIAADPGLQRYLAERGPALRGFAAWCALAERYGTPWQQWPASFLQPQNPAVEKFITSPDGGRRVLYHCWLQHELDRQLGAAGDRGIIADLAIGVDAGGADAWLWQHTFAADVRVGAPPDEFNTKGQDWGLPPWDPWRLRAADYQPFIETVRAGLRRAAGLRFDHVMGLFRLFWIPEGQGPADGTYVHYPYWDLLNLLTLEADRSGAYVVGEDLGTVEDRVRTELRDRRILSYKVLWFEADKPAAWDEQALGSVTTHDLPTVAGVWSGADLEAQRRLDLHPNEAGAEGMRQRLAAWTGRLDDAPVETVIESAYGLLSEAPCRVLTVSLEDLAGVEERPNMPGTIDEWPNWSLSLPVPIEDLEGSALARAVIDRLSGRPAASE